MARGERSHPYLVIFALWLMVFSASSQVIIVAPILPRIGEALLIPEALQGWLITSYALFLSIFALIIGPISDKFGRRVVLLLGSGSMAIALWFHGVADSFESLLAVRAAAGAAGGMLSGAAVSYVGDYFPYNKRGWANGWVMSGIAFGQIVGIPIGTILADQFGFRGAFLMFAGTMTLTTVLIWFCVPQPDVDRDTERLTVARAIAGYRELLSRRVVAFASATYFLMFFSIGLYVIYLPTWLETTLNVSGTSIASLFLVGGLASVISGPMAGKLSDRTGRKPLILVSCFGLSAVMIVTTYWTTSMWVAYVLFGFAMVMFGLRMSPLQSLMTAIVEERRRGALLSLAVAIGQIGIGIGGAAAGFAYVKWGFISNTATGAVAILGMAWLVHFHLPEPQMKNSEVIDLGMEDT
ncbi:MAG: MFS transporter [Bacteroidetes Order II. Incertae sedis bacterium]|nr:MFS transporter [Bacteroidetes Order II. bacterium]MDG1755536.1 MFS transporter [Rhodothermales bacterium]HAY37633.1 MFS transporter [Bacteroidota bacterium]MBT4603857.1 MFS transporter [Bacteroidetes Order II. bacterium]MBT5249228.1 MFS transporter [Bacteroidetes Order II. bacterium]